MVRKPHAVQIQLDVPRHLLFDINALCSFEALTKRPIQSLERAGDVGLLESRALLWAGLLHELPKLTPEEAGEMIGSAPGEALGDKLAYIADKVREAMSRSFALHGAKEKAGASSGNE